MFFVYIVHILYFIIFSEQVLNVKFVALIIIAEYLASMMLNLYHLLNSVISAYYTFNILDFNRGSEHDK